MENWYLQNKIEQFNKIRDYEEFSNFQKIILANRNIVDEYSLSTFYNPDLNNLHSPLLMKDMEKAVDILFESILNDEKIKIVGDYDQDGVSATVILLKGIGMFYSNISYAIPNRIDDGYGLNKNIVDECIADDIHLIITCDNGISAFEAIEYAKSNGIKVLVTDHHEVVTIDGEQVLPNADAIVNPQRLDDEYPYKGICGALVTFKFIQAIYELYGHKLGLDINKINNLIQFAALATVSDMMKIVDENRIVVIEGLKVLNKSPNIGISTLIDEINWTNDINIYVIGFLIGPIINASGRIYTAKLGVELFIEDDINIAREYAKTLVELNNERKKMTNESLEIAINQIINEKLYNNDIIVLYNDSFHESICGLIAGRVKDKFHRPSIILTDSSDEGIIKGSGRSIDTYDMYSNLSKFRDNFNSFGGHKMACGLSFEKTYLNEFTKQINEDSPLNEKDFYVNFDIDYNMNFRQINFNIIDELDKLKPFGYGFSEPKFATKNVNINSINVLGKNKNVVKLYLQDGESIHEGILFNIDMIIDKFSAKYNIKSIDDFEKLKNKKVDVLYRLGTNTFNNRTNIQLNIVSMR